MRLTVFVAPCGPAEVVSDDPADVHEHGVVSRWRWTGCVALGERVELVSGERAVPPPGAVRVRLPRRLSAATGVVVVTRLSAIEALRWLTGLSPINDPWAQSSPELWEAAHPRRGLGLPKPLPQRRPRPCPRSAKEHQT